MRKVAFLLTLVFWCAGVLVPLVALASRVTGASALLWDEDIRAIAWATAKQAAASTVGSVALGLPVGLAAAGAMRGERFARFTDTLFLATQGVPTVVAATAWVTWLGRTGLLARLGLGHGLAYSLEAVVLAHVFFNAPWVALQVAQARRAVPQAPLDAAASLGAGAVSRFRWVTWPLISSSVASASAQVFSMCSMSFALVLILGGGPPVETLETALFGRLRGGSLDLGGAAACAAWQLLLTLVPWAVVVFTARRRTLRGSAARSSRLRPISRAASARFLGSHALTVFSLFWALLWLVPYLSVLTGFAFFTRAEFWSEVSAPLLLSFKIATLTSVGTLFFAIAAIVATHSLAPRSRVWAEAALAIPGGVSVLVLGLGAWLAYGRWIDPFEGSLGAIIGIQVVVFFPTVFRALWPVAQLARKQALETAWTLGASPARAFYHVEWPRWRAPVFSALALVAGLALGEVAAVSLFFSESLTPLPLVVSQWMGQYRFEAAQAASALLLLAALGLMAVVGRDHSTEGSHVG